MTGLACILFGLLSTAGGWHGNNGALLIFGFFLILTGLGCWLRRDQRVNYSVIYDQQREMPPW